MQNYNVILKPKFKGLNYHLMKTFDQIEVVNFSRQLKLLTSKFESSKSARIWILQTRIIKGVNSMKPAIDTYVTARLARTWLARSYGQECSMRMKVLNSYSVLRTRARILRAYQCALVRIGVESLRAG